jgi:hypothetical protein
VGHDILDGKGITEVLVDGFKAIALASSCVLDFRLEIVVGSLGREKDLLLGRRPTREDFA